MARFAIAMPSLRSRSRQPCPYGRTQTPSAERQRAPLKAGRARYERRDTMSSPKTFSARGALPSLALPPAPEGLHEKDTDPVRPAAWPSGPVAATGPPNRPPDGASAEEAPLLGQPQRIPRQNATAPAKDNMGMDFIPV